MTARPRRRGPRRWLLAGAGAVAARVALAGVRAAAPPHWQRQNFRGQQVSLAGGPALALAASVAAAAGAVRPAAGAAALTAGLASGGVGLYDDLVGQRPEQRAKGLRGHFTALRQGRVTSGVVKVLGVGAAGLCAAALLEPAAGRSGPARLGNIALGAGVIAGAANLLNLLDLRPGRALKVGALAAAVMTPGRTGGMAAGTAGACLAALPDDLSERSMLGDSGANALGALLGTALATRTGPVGRATALAALAALTVASERVSFTQVIARTPGLRHLDECGRHPDLPGE